MNLVMIESPLRGDYARNRSYARACLRDSLLRGEAPFAMHLLYAQDGILDVSLLTERDLGIKAGLAWAHKADLVAVYTDLGITEEMGIAIAKADERRIPVEYRSDIWVLGRDIRT